MTSDFLTATPSFLSGMARVLDIFGVFDKYNSSPTPDLADSRALASDWDMVGRDLAAAIESFDTDVKGGRIKQLPLFDLSSPSVG